MTDIVERLRANPENLPAGFVGIQYEAADEIERLRAILEDLISSDAVIESRKKIQDAMLHHSDFKTEFTKDSKKYQKIYNNLKKNWRENEL